MSETAARSDLMALRERLAHEITLYSVDKSMLLELIDDRLAASQPDRSGPSPGPDVRPAPIANGSEAGSDFRTIEQQIDGASPLELLALLRGYLVMNSQPGNDLAPRYIRSIDGALTRPLGGFVQGSIADGGQCNEQSGKQPSLTSVRFELMISRKVGLLFKSKSATICIRDALFDYFIGLTKDADDANAMTKDFLDTIYLQFVRPAVAEMDTRESSESPPPAVFTDPTPT